jgi:type II secretory pathway component GspD/PulD (secretin)
VPRDEITPEPSNNNVQLASKTPLSPPAGSLPLDINPAANATVNYQMMPVDDQGSGSSNGQGSGASPPSLQDMLEEATELATDMLSSSAETDSPRANFPTPTGVATSGFTASPAQSATLSTRDAGTPEILTGKAALADIRIDLFEIVNSPLDQAITLLIAPTDYNIIVDSSVGSSSVSLSFKDSTTDLKSALDLITKAYGLEYTVQANTIVVAGKDKLEGGLISFETRLFVLSYADPKSVKDMLESTGLVAEGQVEIYAGEETYSVVNDSTELSNESGSEQAEIKRIETNLSSTPRNAILVKAVPEHMAEIAQVIADIDRRPRMIELEVRVCEASETALRNLGLELNNNASTPLATNTWWTEQSNEDGAIEAFTAGSFYRSPMNFILQLNSQIQEGTVEVLAQPTLPTVEGKQAIFFAGERIPYIAKVSYTQTGQTQIEVDFLNVGITLSFKPRLDADGRLTIDVNPIVSSLLEFRMIGDLVEAPRTSNRQLATTVHVDNMEPFVLAGLISETERETVTKIPLLGDLPLLGKLFRSTNHKGERTEIIIVVVPRVLE